MPARDDPEPDRGRFEQARRETVRYHEEFYATTPLGQSGTWLARPHRLLHDALALVGQERPVIAYDLGAGVGRHAIPMLRQLPGGSTVIAVDLLGSALQTLERTAPRGPATLRTRTTDLGDFEFESPADLVFAFSAIEHLPDVVSIRGLLERIDTALRPGGVVAIGVVADRYEIDHGGCRRPALLESSLHADRAEALLAETFKGYGVAYARTRPAEVQERRGAETYTLASTLVTWLGAKSS